mmetsp:Transcript_19156/g.53359  ORF Transcript_19156/g.53359 Transcript_19156/m.53359 type:complete len:303 (-) Transcript_19156:127-1035(-)
MPNGAIQPLLQLLSFSHERSLVSSRSRRRLLASLFVCLLAGWLTRSVAQLQQLVQCLFRGLVLPGRIVVVAVDQGLGGPRLALAGDRIKDVVVDGHVQEPQVLEEVLPPLQRRKLVPPGVPNGLGVGLEDRRRLGPAVPQRGLREDAPDAVPFFFLKEAGDGVQLGLGLEQEGPHRLDVLGSTRRGLDRGGSRQPNRGPRSNNSGPGQESPPGGVAVAAIVAVAITIEGFRCRFRRRCQRSRAASRVGSESRRCPKGFGAGKERRRGEDQDEKIVIKRCHSWLPFVMRCSVECECVPVPVPY